MQTQCLCRKNGLIAYDAAYLGLAIRCDCELTTVNEELHKAVESGGVAML